MTLTQCLWLLSGQLAFLDIIDKGRGGTWITKSEKQSPEMFCKKGVLRNFTKITGKHLCQSLFFNKVEGVVKSQNHFDICVKSTWWIYLLQSLQGHSCRRQFFISDLNESRKSGFFRSTGSTSHILRPRSTGSTSHILRPRSTGSNSHILRPRKRSDSEP